MTENEGVTFGRPEPKPEPMPKPRMRVFPSPVPCEHAVLVVSTSRSRSHDLAYWYYRGVRRAKPWFVGRLCPRAEVIRSLRDHHPCDIYFMGDRNAL